MRLQTLNGNLVFRNVEGFRINWDGKCRSMPQFHVKQLLKPFWSKQIVYEEFPVYGTLLKVDIFNATSKIAIEVQGAQHDNFNEFFHNKSRFKYYKAIKNDVTKRKWLELNDYQLVEIYENETKQLTENNIKEFLKSKFDITV